MRPCGCGGACSIPACTASRISGGSGTAIHFRLTKPTDIDARIVKFMREAEEVGLSRRSVERALAERLNLPATPPVVGSLTWARSADGKAHVAEVLSLSQEEARVRFLRGGEHRVTLDELRPCAFIPGERVACHWPMWGPWTCTVIGYDSVNQRVKLSDGWGYTKTFPVSEVWLPPAKADSRTPVVGASSPSWPPVPRRARSSARSLRRC